MLRTRSPTDSDAIGRSPVGVAIGVSGEAQTHSELQKPSLPHSQHPESVPLSRRLTGPPGGRHFPDGSPVKRQVPGEHGSSESFLASIAESVTLSVDVTSELPPASTPPLEVVTPPQFMIERRVAANGTATEKRM
jgi:hypothetical protein